MGILRTILALTVLINHSGLPFGIGTRNSVQLFYIISGFLISYILLNNKTYQDPVKFYANRCLRLYPVYYVVALLYLMACVIANPRFLDMYRTVPFDAYALLVASNLFIFGQDWVMFLGIHNGSLTFVADYHDSAIVLCRGLLVPQAWTLGVELTFYLVAPFILRDKRKIFSLLSASLLLRVIFLRNGVGWEDPWTYRFFPLELGLFLFGALSHQILLPIWEKFLQESKLKIDKIGVFFLIGLSIIYPWVPLAEMYKTLFLFIVFTLFVPLTFIFQNKSSIDRLVGELSYPLYIGHVFVIRVVDYLMDKFAFTNSFIIISMQILFSIIFAFLLDRIVARKVEKLRTRIKSASY